MAAIIPRGYRSVTEYRFREEQRDAVLRAAAYHRKDYCYSVIWFSPREHVGIRQSIATPFWRNSNMGLGSLDRLPFELLHNVLLPLDMHSVFNFRQTNLRSRQTVEADDDDAFESEYRLRIGNQVKYLVISRGTFDRGILLFTLQFLLRLPYRGWDRG